MTKVVAKKKILLLSDDLRMSSGVGTMSREFVYGTLHKYDWVQIGGDVGITPHCVIGDGAKIGAKSGVMHDIPAGQEWLGVPAVPVRDMLRQWSSTRKLPTFLAEFARKNKER